MLRTTFTSGVICLALVVFAARTVQAGDAQTINIDELPRKIIQLPNGLRSVVILYQDHNWREVEAVVLMGTEERDVDVCFEAKFDSVYDKNKIRLFGTPGTLIVEEPAKIRIANGMARGDNVWFCGTLSKNRETKAIEFMVVDLIKLPPDIQRYNARILLHEKKNDADALIELGHKIEHDRKQDLKGFAEFDQLGALKDKAFDLGLTIKEKQLKPGDADGLYALAIQWRELRRKNPKFRELVYKCLQADPDHPKAARVAEEEMGLTKFEGKWLRKDEIERIMAQRKAEQDRLDAAQRAALDAKKRDLEEAIAQRPLRLATHQLALCTSDAKAREGALTSLGEAIEKSVDPGFGEEAVEVLVNINDPAAVFPALDMAGRSQFSEVRRLVFEALAWRGGQQDQNAFDVLARALRAEKDNATAKSGVEAVLSVGGKGCIGTLIKALAAEDKLVRDEIMEGLKSATKQQISNKDGWEAWYSKNHDFVPTREQ